MLGVQTLGDLASRTEAELMGVKNFGQTSLDELRQILASNGLTLRQLD
jgi:DNA-directed RNA polymerase subunit alpha